jgi:hypothetical protein
MKEFCFILIGLAAGLVLMSARAQDSAVAQLGNITNSTATISVPLEITAAPMLALGPDRHATGLFVDLAKPQQTWILLNPLTPPSKKIQWVDVPAPMAEHNLDGNLANHEAGLVLFRLSFR